MIIDDDHHSYHDDEIEDEEEAMCSPRNFPQFVAQHWATQSQDLGQTILPPCPTASL